MLGSPRNGLLRRHNESMNEIDHTNTASGSDRDEPPSSKEADQPPEPNDQPLIDVLVDGELTGVDTAWLTHHAAMIPPHLKRHLLRLSVRIVGDQEMAALHEQFSGVEGTTDVLTFPSQETSTSGIDVDIAICHDEAQRHTTAGGDVNRELLLYIVHGVLHCDGEDDGDAASSVKMHLREDEILTAIGVGHVHGPPIIESEATQ